MKIDIVKHRWGYIGASIALLIPGLVFLILSVTQYPNHAPLRLGIDFTGGTILEYGFQNPVTQADLPTLRHEMDAAGYPGSVVQIQQGLAGDAKAGETPVQAIVSIRTKPLEDDTAQQQIQNRLQQRFGPLQLLQKNAIGPTLASELLTQGLLALLAAYVLIVGYLTFRFQLDYALCAIVALVHDSLFVVGAFSMLGYLFHTEVDSLFITGILTVVGFSVHDTIVVFDRLRENSRLLFAKKLPFGEIANISVNQTLRRSINTSVTALLTLIALYVLGGETTRDFVLTMILGILVGTYSSIFVASAILSWWRDRSGPASASAVAAAGA